jgi:hypothetical protein
MTITICGSTRFKDQILEVAEGLTLDGHIVMMPTVFRHDDPNLTTEMRIRLENQHREMINKSDAIFVVNVDKYIGEATYSMLDWATRMKKEVYFLEEINPQTEEAEPVAPKED